MCFYFDEPFYFVRRVLEEQPFHCCRKSGAFFRASGAVTLESRRPIVLADSRIEYMYEVSAVSRLLAGPYASETLFSNIDGAWSVIDAVLWSKNPPPDFYRAII